VLKVFVRRAKRLGRSSDKVSSVKGGKKKKVSAGSYQQKAWVAVDEGRVEGTNRERSRKTGAVFFRVGKGHLCRHQRPCRERGGAQSNYQKKKQTKDGKGEIRGNNCPGKEEQTGGGQPVGEKLTGGQGEKETEPVPSLVKEGRLGNPPQHGRNLR